MQSHLEAKEINSDVLINIPSPSFQRWKETSAGNLDSFFLSLLHACVPRADAHAGKADKKKKPCK